MKSTFEISLYPLTEDYSGVILQFIHDLKKHDSIQIYSTAMSTYITGDFENVMNILSSELKKVYEIIPDSSTVVKIIPKPLNVEAGYLNL